MRKLLFGLLGLLFSISANAACNLFDKDTIELGKRLDDSGNILNESNGFVSAKIYVVPNTTYTWQQATTEGVYLRIGEYNSSGFVKLDKGKLLGTQTLTFTTSANTSYVLVSSYSANLDKNQLEQGSTATAYTPYNPLCATCDGTVMNYTSATGTVSQNGTPTPTNPVDPVFYTQGDMVLRKVGDYADSYDATTGKITRRVGVKVLDGVTAGAKIGTAWNTTYKRGSFAVSDMKSTAADVSDALSSHFEYSQDVYGAPTVFGFGTNNGTIFISFLGLDNVASADTANAWLAEQYAAGTPVTIWYPLATAVEEDWPSSYCQQAIKVASTKYVESQFSALNTALANAVATVNTVVTQTIAQAASIATLQSGKQTRPDETCPAGIKCLLVEDTNGTPHWYAIQESYLPLGYTPLEYIESTGTQYIDTGITGTQDTAIETKFINLSSDSSTTVLIGDGWSNSSYLLSIVAQTGAPNWIGSLNNMLRDFWQTGQDYIVKMDKTGLYVNNSKINWDGSATNFTTTKPLYLLGDPATSGRNSYAMLYYMKIYNNGTLVRDFVPAKNASGAIGMYDLVSGEFFTNRGSGSFIAGPVVE